MRTAPSRVFTSSQGRSREYHGCSKPRSPEYSSWRSMIDRCTNPVNRSYKLYGAKGIKVCKAWSESFMQFWWDMGNRPEGYDLSRLDHDKDYEPGNCEWQPKEKNRSTRGAH